MSLLMEALKKAELAKRQQQSEGAAGATDAAAQDHFTLEPLNRSRASPAAPTDSAAPGAAAGGTLPRLPTTVEELDAQFLLDAQQAAAARLRTAMSPKPVRPPHETPAPARNQPPSAASAEVRQPQAGPSSAQDKSAARNLFTAKQAGKPVRKNFALVVGMLTVASVGGIGGYFWWQLQPKNTLVARGAALRSSPPLPATSVAVAPAPTPAVAPAAGMVNAALPAIRADGEDEEPSVSVATAAPVRTRRTNSAPAAPIESDGAVRVSKAPLKVDPALLRGFDAFNRGDLVEAQSEYERARQADARNTDALHGLAAIAVRQGRVDQAELLYRQIAEADPQDSVALSALINMRGHIDPNAAESRLKSLSAAQPDLAAPQFALGNLYARQGRWNDAQQAYFRAYSAEPDNPDIIYNLAISLEHLRQNKLAAQYYSQAIAAAEGRLSGVDKSAAAARLRALQP